MAAKSNNEMLSYAMQMSIQKPEVNMPCLEKFD